MQQFTDEKRAIRWLNTVPAKWWKQNRDYTFSQTSEPMPTLFKPYYTLPDYVKKYGEYLKKYITRNQFRIVFMRCSKTKKLNMWINYLIYDY